VIELSEVDQYLYLTTSASNAVFGGEFSSFSFTGEGYLSLFAGTLVRRFFNEQFTTAMFQFI
jgi:hypothetical protein